MNAWPIMNTEKIADELLKAARAAGVEVRELRPAKEDLKPRSGFAILRGRPVVFLEPGLPSEERIKTLLLALKARNLENVFLSPAARRLIEAAK